MPLKKKTVNPAGLTYDRPAYDLDYYAKNREKILEQHRILYEKKRDPRKPRRKRK